MADQRIYYTEQMVGAGHPTKTDTLNRLSLVEHNTDGTHKALTHVTDPYIDVRAYGATGDGVTDDTAPIQAAIDAAETAGGGIIFFPRGTYKGNWTLKSRVHITGVGENVTKFKPYVDAPVFAAPAAGLNRISLTHFTIVGDQTMNSNDGIQFKPSTGPVEKVVIEFVRIERCGRYGVHMYGSGTTPTDPYCQQFSVRHLSVNKCDAAGLFIEGVNLENSFHDLFVNNNDLDATSGFNLGIKGLGGASDYPQRTKFFGGVINGVVAGGAPSVHIEHAEQVGFYGVDFEAGQPAVNITTNNIDRIINITFQGCKFLAQALTTSALFTFDWCNGLVLDNNTFEAEGTSALTSFIIESGAGAGRIVNLDIRDNNRFIVKAPATVTTPIDVSPLDTPLAAGVLKKYNRHMRVDTEADAAMDDLDTIEAMDGTTNFVDGEMLTIRADNPARTVVVKHNTGNIMLKAGADTSLLDDYVTVTLRWDSVLGKWLEI